MLNIAKRLASRLPSRMQDELQRWSYGFRIRTGRFDHAEPEFTRLADWIRAGDTVIDVGANVGMYTMRMSELVGASGRVFAFEPIPRTFALLSANTRLLNCDNVTLLNAAASESFGYVELEVPMFENGLAAYTRASIGEEVDGPSRRFSAFALPADHLQIPSRVSFVKIDVEGHELSVLKGMEDLLVRDVPTIVLEGDHAGVSEFLNGIGYDDATRIAGSPNNIYQVSGDLHGCPQVSELPQAYSVE